MLSWSLEDVFNQDLHTNKVIRVCLSSFHRNHKSTVDLIWVPPGTGKTKTLGTLLYALLKVNCRTLVCALTNVAIKEVASVFGYFYMVSAWGGYVFIINLVPLYVLVLLVTWRYSLRLYVAYNCMYVLGMLLAMQIRFVGLQLVQSGEHMASLGVFFLTSGVFLFGLGKAFAWRFKIVSSGYEDHCNWCS